MPMEMEVTLRVVVQNEEEANRLQEAVFSGLAAELLRIGVIYGQIPLGGAYAPPAMPVNTHRREAKAAESAIELQRIADQEVAPVVVEEKKEKTRPKGIAGRKRMRRD